MGKELAVVPLPAPPSPLSVSLGHMQLYKEAAAKIPASGADFQGRKTDSGMACEVVLEGKWGLWGEETKPLRLPAHCTLSHPSPAHTPWPL